MNIGAIQSYYQAAQVTGATRNASESNPLPATSENKGTTENVSLSGKGKLLADLVLPTRENVRKMSAELSGDLKKLFDEAGISSDPPIEFDVDSYTGKVSVKGNRPDAPQIAELIKNNRDIELKIHNVAAISSHIGPMEKAMEADSAYRAAQTQAEQDKVIAKYASVYSGQMDVVNFSLIFNGGDIQILADGAPWMSSKA